MPAKKIRFGVIGCGVIAYWTHLRLLRRLKNTTLVAATDPNPEAREKASRLTHVPIYENAGELLERDDIDAVVICAPTHLHAELAIAAAKARKHFYLEKPIASTVADGRRVIDAVKDAGVSAAIGFNRRVHPAFEQARALVAAGRIGRVRAIVTVFSEPVSCRFVIPSTNCHPRQDRHPERSEGSAFRRELQIPRSARDDNLKLGTTIP